MIVLLLIKTRFLLAITHKYTRMKTLFSTFALFFATVLVAGIQSQVNAQSIDIDVPGVDIEGKVNGENVDVTIDTGNVNIDAEVVGEDVDAAVDTGDVYIDANVDGEDVDASVTTDSVDINASADGNSAQIQTKPVIYTNTCASLTTGGETVNVNGDQIFIGRSSDRIKIDGSSVFVQTAVSDSYTKITSGEVEMSVEGSGTIRINQDAVFINNSEGSLRIFSENNGSRMYVGDTSVSTVNGTHLEVAGDTLEVYANDGNGNEAKVSVNPERVAVIAEEEGINDVTSIEISVENSVSVYTVSGKKEQEVLGLWDTEIPATVKINAEDETVIEVDSEKAVLDFFSF
jgi:ribosome-associated translation inhibitor RaiA